jgi:uncharacterized protein (TIRG00374 family)
MNFLRRQRKTLLTVVFIVLVFVLLFFFIDPAEIWREFQNTDWRLLAVAWVFLLAGILLISARWRYFLHYVPDYRTVLKSDGMSHATTCLSPIPSAALRVITISRLSVVTMAQASTGMIVDRLLESIMRVFCLLLAVAVYARLLVSPVALAGNLAVVVAGLLLIFWLISRPVQVERALTGWARYLPGVEVKKVQPMIARLIQGFVLAGSPARFLTALGITIVMWGCFFIFQALVLVAMNLGLDTRQVAALSLAVLAVAPPSAPAMPGIYHGVVVASLALLGILNASSLTAYAILSHALYLALWLPLGIWGFLRSDLRLRDLVRLQRAAPSAAGGDAAHNEAGQE